MRYVVGNYIYDTEKSTKLIDGRQDVSNFKSLYRSPKGKYFSVSMEEGSTKCQPLTRKRAIEIAKELKMEPEELELEFNIELEET